MSHIWELNLKYLSINEIVQDIIYQRCSQCILHGLYAQRLYICVKRLWIWLLVILWWATLSNLIFELEIAENASKWLNLIYKCGNAIAWHHNSWNIHLFRFCVHWSKVQVQQTIKKWRFVEVFYFSCFQFHEKRQHKKMPVMSMCF